MSSERVRDVNAAPRPRSGRSGLLHPPTQAERTHVGPDLADMGQARVPVVLSALIAPTGGQLPVCWPDRVLLLVVHDHAVRLLVWGLVSHLHLPESLDEAGSHRRVTAPPRTPAASQE